MQKQIDILHTEVSERDHLIEELQYVYNEKGEVLQSREEYLAMTQA
jgi:hypothetical protein